MKDACCSNPAKSFVTVLRLLVGAWLLYLGIAKWAGGASGFVGYIVTQFASTGSPALVTTGLAWLILVAEPLIGLWLIVGCAPKLAWLSATLLFFALTLGQTMLGEYNTVANNWQYVVLAAAAFALTCANSCNSAGACCSKDTSKTGHGHHGGCCS